MKKRYLVMGIVGFSVILGILKPSKLVAMEDTDGYGITLQSVWSVLQDYPYLMVGIPFFGLIITALTLWLINEFHDSSKKLKATKAGNQIGFDNQELKKGVQQPNTYNNSTTTAILAEMVEIGTSQAPAVKEEHEKFNN